MDLTVQLRRAGILLALAATSAAIFVERPGRARAEAASAVATNSPMMHGLEAWAGGRLEEADHWLRNAWLVDPARHTAAQRLRELHDARGFRLATDEDAITLTQQQLGRGFRRSETKHFVILSNCNSAWTRNKASILERTRHEFFRFAKHLGLPVIPHERKLLCVLINDHEQYQSFAREHDHLSAGWIAGHYSIDSNRVVFYNDLTSPAFAAALHTLDGYDDLAQQERGRADRAPTRDQAQSLMRHAGELEREARARREDLGDQADRFATAKTIHEAVHLLSFNTGVQAPSRAYPLWLSEGLASSFETDDPSRAFGPLYPSETRENTFRRLRDEHALIPWGDLLTLREPPPSGDQHVEAIYAQSLVLFSHLARFHSDALGAYLLNATNHAPDPGEDNVARFERFFGPLDNIAREIKRF